MTTSFIFLTFSNVSFVVLFRTRLAGEKIKIGGFALKTLKKLPIRPQAPKPLKGLHVFMRMTIYYLLNQKIFIQKKFLI